MRSVEAYPRAVMERAMKVQKVQDVISQAMAKKITWWRTAEILGISDRNTRQWREHYVEEGYNGCWAGGGKGLAIDATPRCTS